MATISFNPLVAVDFTTLITTRSSIDVNNATSYDFDTSDGADIDMEGSGLTYDGSGNVTGGTITRIDIDINSDQGALNGGDINISGLNITNTTDLGSIDNGPFSLFGTALQGDDTFLMSGMAEDIDTPAATNRIFGDDLQNLTLLVIGGTNTNTGGDDVFSSADNRFEVSGDVWSLNTPGGILISSTYNGGDDTYFGAITEEFHRVAGDAWSIDRGDAQMTLNGGDDKIDLGGNSSGSSFIAGDVVDMNNGVVNGGDDELTSDDSATPEVAGDVRNYNGGTLNGGDDIITAANSSRIGGDVMFLNAPVPAGVFTLTCGDDQITGGGGDDIIGGDIYDRNSAVDNVIIGGDDVIYGGAGDDDIFGEVVFGDGVTSVSGGNDVLYGGAGNDEVRGQTGDDFIDGGSGNDTLDGGVGYDILSYRTAKGGVAVNLLVVGAQNTLGAGVDSIVGFEGLEGSRYDDTLRGNNVSNEIDGGAGNDLIFSGAGSDILIGGVGNDTLNSAGQTSDLLIGGEGDDLLETSGGGNTLVGGAGIDTISFSTVAGAVTIDLTAGTAQQDGSTTSDSFSQVENATGGAGADHIIGDAAANVLDGLGGADDIRAGEGADSIIGGAGADTLRGDAGADTIDGGADADDIRGGDDDDVISGGADKDKLNGDAGRDLLNGGAAGDVLRGGDNNDTLIGGSGKDDLRGDDGVDSLNGGAGDDTLDGGAGNDVLIGGKGADIYIGGSGADTMVFSPTSGQVVDVITSFEDTGGISDDLIDVSAYGFVSVASITASADGDDVLLDFGGGDRVRLQGYLLTHTLNDIGADDFIL